MEELLEFISTARDARELKRALAVKLTLEGYVHAEIIKILNVTSGFISKWKQAFEADGVDGILLGYQGSTGYLYKEQRQEVIEWLQQKDHWLLEELVTHLSQEYDVEFKSRQSYYDLFTQAGLSWKKTQKRNPKHNPEEVAAQKKLSTNACSSTRRMLLQGKVRVLMLDECHLLWGDLCGYVWGKTNERIEVDMTNYRNKQTYFGAVDYHTGEFLVKPYDKGNSDHTIEFLQFLQAQSPGQRLVVIWDGASYHRSEQMQQYLEQVNAGLVQSNWQLHCLRFAPNAPQQNPVEDIWLQAKTYVRQRYYQCPSFKSLGQLFMQFLDGRVFDFPKLHLYG